MSSTSTSLISSSTAGTNVVAFTAASFPWILVSLYFVFVLLPADLWGSLAAWQETPVGRDVLLHPTSAGVLFSMLAAAGLGTTWLFRKARILAIFDDLGHRVADGSG